jgi:hypothetical protein
LLVLFQEHSRHAVFGKLGRRVKIFGCPPFTAAVSQST